MPPAHAVSVVTLAELTSGVLLARDDATRARRLATLSYLESTFEPLPIDGDVARSWAALAARARARGRRVSVNDCWIAATATVHGLAVFTQDRDYDELGIDVVRV